MNKKILFMKEENSPIDNLNKNPDNSPIEYLNADLDTTANDSENSKWVDNQGDEVKNVFGFNSSAELVNGRAAMVGFLMLILTELVFSGRPVTSSIFGIN